MSARGPCARIPARAASPPVAALVALAALVVLAATSVPAAAGQVVAPSARAPQAGAVPARGRVVLVGDSIMLGAKPDLEAAFAASGYEVVVDAAESRSTLAGAGVLTGHLGAGADAVVLMLGANDAGNTGAYRERVRSVLAGAALVPHVYWMTTPEVRSYYPAANQVVREEIASRPGAEVLEWHSVSSGGGLTAGDGLHLTGEGARVMAWFVAVNVIADLDPLPPPTTTVPTAPATSTPAPTVPVSTAPGPGATDGGPGGTDGGSGAPQSDSPDDPDGNGGGDGQLRRAEQAAEVAAESSVWRFASTAAVAAGVVVALLGLAGMAMAGWSLWRTR